MKYIRSYESLEETYKALYVTPLIVEKTGCYLMSYYPIDIQKKIRMIADLINDKYKDDIVVGMVKSPVTGLIINKGDIEPIANQVYELYTGLEYGSRVVYGEGQMTRIKPDINICDGELLVRIGRYMDTLKGKTGVFKA